MNSEKTTPLTERDSARLLELRSRGNEMMSPWLRNELANLELRAVITPSLTFPNLQS